MHIKVNKKEMKKEAIKRMKILKLHQNVLDDFINENKLHKSETTFGALYWLDEKELEMIKDFENKHNVIVYHIIHTFSNLGETYELLFITKEKDEWEAEKVDLKNGFALAQVIVMDYSPNSEMGYIGIESWNGGLVRKC